MTELGIEAPELVPPVGRAIISLSLFALESDEELEVPELTFMQSGIFFRSQLYKSLMARRVAAQIASLLANAGATDADRATRASSLLSSPGACFGALEGGRGG